MISPEDIKAKAQKLWDSGRLLRAWLGAGQLFPWSLPLGCPRGGRPLDDFAAVRVWKEELELRCKCGTGIGFRIEYAEVEHGELGQQRWPERAVFDEPMDVVAFLGRRRDVGDFARLARDIRLRFPVLKVWIEAEPMQVLTYGDEWPRLLAVLDHFAAHPRPGCYLRELVIPGVDTEFIETRKRLLAALLDRVLPASALNEQVAGHSRHGFERRYGLRFDAP